VLIAAALLSLAPPAAPTGPGPRAVVASAEQRATTSRATTSRATAPLELARGGRTRYTVVHAPDASDAERLAAAELAAYLGRMTGAVFPVAEGRPAERALRHVVRLRLAAPGEVLPGDTLTRPTAVAADALRGDAYAIAVRGDTLELIGRSGRAVLYASYDLLARLGCRWLAPALDFYEGTAERVPRRRTLLYDGPRAIVERPRFAIRKLDVEEGLSHDTASLRRMIAWMPKARFNTLQVPLDYGGRGRVRWDAWREALAPELARRGLAAEVGGHGYENFLRADRDDDSLFVRHASWFGRDSTCRPSRAGHLVFNTSDTGAVRHVAEGVAAYLKERPEIAVFDFWPPDGARWAECREWEALGAVEDRQARLVNAVREAVRRVRPDVRLEVIAYAHAKSPPQGVALAPDVLVDFCPIGQNFDVQIDDSAGANNAQYVAAIRDWRRRFPGDVGLYSYFRRYAWLSLPVLLPRYMQHDLRWYASVPLQGVSSYAEPGDWFTYELNHYALGALAWDPDLDMDALLGDYAAARYGAPAATAARAALEALEDVVRTSGSIQYSRPRPAERIADARARLAERAADVGDARAGATPSHAAALDRLALMLEYATRDLEIQEARASGAGAAAVEGRIEALAGFLTANGDRGVFLLTGRDDRARIARHYRP
jgi:hypothetical protein